MEIEMQPLDANGRNGEGAAAHETLIEQVPCGRLNGENGASLAAGQSVLPWPQPPQRYQKNKVVCMLERVRTALTKPVFGRCTVWMTILFILLFIAVVIFTSIALCSVLREDPDDTYDSSSYTVRQDFNGTFQLTNQVLAEELLDGSSNQSQVLASQLQEKLSGLYSISPALARYFTDAEVYAFSTNGSTEAEFSLSFRLPPETAEQLGHFTLSRELVYNVLRQSLYDQETDPPGPLQIDPGSLRIN